MNYTILDELVCAGIISEQDLAIFKQNPSGDNFEIIIDKILKNTEVQADSNNQEKSIAPYHHSQIEDCVLVKFDERDLINGAYTTPENVNLIAKGAFKGCKNIEKLTISSGVTIIQDSAFAYCTSLKSIKLPNSLSQIGNGAFFGCTGLTNIKLPSRIVELPQFVFAGCVNLIEIKLPSRLYCIATNAFWACKNLTTINLDENFQQSWNKGTFKCPNNEIEQLILNRIDNQVAR